MARYIVTYDIRNDGESDLRYSKLYALLDDYPSKKVTESSYVVASHLTAELIFDHLASVLKKKDTIFVAEISVTNCQGWLSKDVWEWLDDPKNV